VNPRGLILAHYQEVGLKGRNRSFFERTLASNIHQVLSDIPGAEVTPIVGRILIRLPEEQISAAAGKLTHVFGLSSFSPAVELVAPNMDALVEQAILMAGTVSFESFRVSARRGNSSFRQTSMEVNNVVGQALKERIGARVDLSHPDWTCHIELVTNRAYLYSEKIKGPGGLPVGSSGRVMALLSGGIDSPVAAWKMAKRGATVDFIHFHGQPYADPSSARQAAQLVRHLAPWTLRSRLFLIQFGDVQAEIVTSAAQELRVVLYRRFMMRIAEALAHQEGAEGLVTGECLGQVASQTLPNLRVIDDAVEALPILRPLVGDDKLEIEQTGKHIGTYDISIQPHQDCCVLFVPKRVTTAAKLEDVRAAESLLDIQALVGKAVANAEIVDARYRPEGALAPPDY
jgi:thiamine biosynthesis protein ThiI